MSAHSDSWILHHYEDSPYAEKIRLMFGHAGMAWQSVLSPSMPPRPNLDPLTGGYRRIPVAQVGADIFCDTALIATEIARHTERAEWRPDSVPDPQQALVQHAQSTVFFSVITSEPPLPLLKALIGKFGWRQTWRFFKDRTAMMKAATIRPPSGKEAAQVVAEFFQQMDTLLADKPFLGGESPAYADFAAIHPVTFKINLTGKPLPASHENLKRWVNAMEAPGHGARAELEPSAAFAAAADAEPRALPASQEHEALGQRVAIGPVDYGLDPVQGRLTAVTPERYIIARDTDAFGLLHVHFPRGGYQLTAL